MNYSMLAGGKRLRPIMMREIYRMLGKRQRDGGSSRSWLAMEMIHTAFSDP